MSKIASKQHQAVGHTTQLSVFFKFTINNSWNLHDWITSAKTFQIPQNLRTEKFQCEILELSFAAEARFQISLEASDEIRILFRENHHPDIIDNELPAKMNLSDKTVWRRASTNKTIVFEPRESSYGKAISDKPSDQRFT